MPREVIGKIPEFTQDTPLDETGKVEEVKETPAEEAEEEKETPAEPPAEEKPTEELPKKEEPEVDTGEVAELRKQMQGLAGEKEKLLEEIKDLRGARRELKAKELEKVEKKIDELKDIYPEDIALIDRIVKARGYISKDEVNRMIYNQVKQTELDQFLGRYPEYKPENDPNNINWNALTRELSYYRMPENPHLIGEILERAHRTVSQHPSDRGTPAKKKRAEIAGVGAGGTQRSSLRPSLTPRQREELSRGGWTDKEIDEIEGNLEE